VRSVIRTRSIKALAEEMGDDYLEQDLGGRPTLTRRIASSLSLYYRNTDLTLDERIQMGLDPYAKDGTPETAALGAEGKGLVRVPRRSRRMTRAVHLRREPLTPFCRTATSRRNPSPRRNRAVDSEWMKESQD